ncbi:hypothetical protein HL658_22590 [Azospirillum sp. RWY-5-1]|uniref:Thiol:disulfide interchange protein DsbD N-terminal domain-containing protein n=1 Tax=Azospirillum oleiclasticum TaxID=2735135 RepID=A0ABX2TDL9_9PROT|nr:hypothetical protein [Azospirillum oleiclasticum]NYZ15336.1 hypothetical protein [Azospirillum oleiclasticum]NYZ21243.1 hypothetical protein [Azospirillum oleiclasticum]
MSRVVAAGLLLVALARPALAADPERVWSETLDGATVTVSLEARGRAGAVVVSVQPLKGVTIKPPVLRLDASALIREHIGGALPTTVRGEGGAMRARLPLDRAGSLRIATPDSHDGTLRIEYRYCREAETRCSVERLDLALKVAR